jgi:hypothetical protein
MTTKKRGIWKLRGKIRVRFEVSSSEYKKI